MFLHPAAGTLHFRLPLDVFRRNRRINLAGAPVAQLDRASAFEAEGREFESLRARHFPQQTYVFNSSWRITLPSGLDIYP